MPHVTVRRADRARTLAPVTLLEFEALDRTHGEVIHALRELERLLARVEADDLDTDARALARVLCGFFDGTARIHHEDEERVVFPPLLTGTDVELIQHVRRLQQDHSWLEEDWRELRPQLVAIAEGIDLHDADTLRQMATVFGALYVEHIALEESLIYPAARLCRAAAEIAQRRRDEASV